MPRSALPNVKAGDTMQICCVNHLEGNTSLLCMEDLKNFDPPSYLSEEGRKSWQAKPGWGLAGGGVREGENALEAADRELYEETGLTLLVRDADNLPVRDFDGKVITFDGLDLSLAYTEKRRNSETGNVSSLYIVKCTYTREMGTIDVNDPEGKVIQAAWVDLGDLQELCYAYGKSGHLSDCLGRHFYRSHVERLTYILKEVTHK